MVDAVGSFDIETTDNNDITQDKDVEIDRTINDLKEESSRNSSPMEEWKMLTLTQEVLCTNVGELEEAVALCNDAVKIKEKDTPEWNMLVRRLIELKLRLHNLKEALKDEQLNCEPLQDRSVVLGHHFLRQNRPKSLATSYCDRCSGVIWDPIHSWHICTDCDYRCHTWCVAQVCRVCTHMLVTESPSYDLEICPEASDGLVAQNYRCAECLMRTKLGVASSEPRLCDYNGKYYCSTCHWNSTAVIPARIVNNWDFTERRVCRATKQRLKMLSTLPILQLEALNPVLFASVDELVTIKALRKRLLQMKKYLTSCKAAMDEKLAWQQNNRQHFLECDDKYSVQDLLDLRSGVLIADITRLMNSFKQHITKHCTVCRNQGFICELCKSNSVIFPFEPDVESCADCGAAYHRQCFLNLETCLKCVRRQSRHQAS